MSFLAELKRRNVFRMSGLYLVGMWPVCRSKRGGAPHHARSSFHSWTVRVVILHKQSDSVNQHLECRQ